MLVGKLLTVPTRFAYFCTAQISKFQQKFVHLFCFFLFTKQISKCCHVYAQSWLVFEISRIFSENGTSLIFAEMFAKFWGYFLNLPKPIRLFIIQFIHSPPYSETCSQRTRGSGCLSRTPGASRGPAGCWRPGPRLAFQGGSSSNSEVTASVVVLCMFVPCSMHIPCRFGLLLKSAVHILETVRLMFTLLYDEIVNRCPLGNAQEWKLFGIRFFEEIQLRKEETLTSCPTACWRFEKTQIRKNHSPSSHTACWRF